MFKEYCAEKNPCRRFPQIKYKQINTQLYPYKYHLRRLKKFYSLIISNPKVILFRTGFSSCQSDILYVPAELHVAFGPQMFNSLVDLFNEYVHILLSCNIYVKEMRLYSIYQIIYTMTKHKKNMYKRQRWTIKKEQKV